MVEGRNQATETACETNEMFLTEKRFQNSHFKYAYRIILIESKENMIKEIKEDMSTMLHQIKKTIIDTEIIKNEITQRK